MYQSGTSLELRCNRADRHCPVRCFACAFGRGASSEKVQGAAPGWSGKDGWVEREPKRKLLVYGVSHSSDCCPSMAMNEVGDGLMLCRKQSQERREQALLLGSRRGQGTQEGDLMQSMLSSGLPLGDDTPC